MAAGTHCLFGHQIQQHAWIDLSRPRAHRQPVKRGKAHRAFDAFSASQSAHRSAAAKMRDDDTSVCDSPAQLRTTGRRCIRTTVREIRSAGHPRDRNVQVSRSGRRPRCDRDGMRCRSRRPAADPGGASAESGSAPDCSADAAAQADIIARDASARSHRRRSADRSRARRGRHDGRQRPVGRFCVSRSQSPAAAIAA